MKNIVVPIDFSSVTDAVVRLVGKLAAGSDVKVHLVHVIPAYTTELLDPTHPKHEQVFVANEMRREFHALHAVAGKLAELGCEVKPILAEGRIVERILDEIERAPADLVVIGSHGHSRFRDMLVGGVCESVLRECPVPVAVVPTTSKGSTVQ
jgi:nucleotide-binding universal stress UspA family protein